MSSLGKSKSTDRKEYMRNWRKANPEKVRAQQRAYREANPEKVRAQQQAWRDANPELVIKIQKKSRAVRKKRSQTDPDVALRNMVTCARTRAKKDHREFDIDVDYVKKLWQRQQGLCKLSGLPMSIAIGSAELRVSLDRKNNAKGYVKGNVQLLRSMVNNAKNKYSQTDFVKMCRAVAKINPK